LLTFWGKNSIISKISRRRHVSFFRRIVNWNPPVCLVDMNNNLMISFNLSFGKRTTSYNDFDCLSFWNRLLGWH
jgi:hypothetical protein